MSGGGDSGSSEVPETEHEKALAEVTMGQWNRYKDVFRPLENEYLNNLEMTEGDKSVTKGQVNVGVGKAFSDKAIDTEKGLMSAGYAPGNKLRSAISGLNLDRASATGSAMGRAGQALDDVSLANLENAVKMGRGEATDATRDLTTLASDATSEAINKAFQDEEEKDTLGSSVATAAGMGLAGWTRPQKISLAGG